jgi:PAS domain-containing protein
MDGVWHALRGGLLGLAMSLIAQGQAVQSWLAMPVGEGGATLTDAHRFAAIIEFSEDAIISKDLNGIITSWNPGAERLFGYSAEEAIGKPVTILIPPDRQDEEPMILGRVRSGERIEHYENGSPSEGWQYR